MEARVIRNLEPASRTDHLRDMRVDVQRRAIGPAVQLVSPHPEHIEEPAPGVMPSIISRL
jgi:hypothetical protein